MRIAHLGHAAVLVEVAQRRILIDPGNFSTAWHGLTDLDAVLVTHQHPDHIDAIPLAHLLAANPQAQVHVEPEVLQMWDVPGAVGFSAGTAVELGGVTISAVGGRHAVIHPDIPTIGNVGLLIEAADGPRLFHPGDALAAVPPAVDVLAIPAYGPWAAMKETIDFVREVNAPKGFLIHEGLLSDRGQSLIATRIPELTATALLPLTQELVDVS